MAATNCATSEGRQTQSHILPQLTRRPKDGGAASTGNSRFSFQSCHAKLCGTESLIYRVVPMNVKGQNNRAAMGWRLQRVLSRNPIPWLAAIYLFSTFVRVPSNPATLQGTPHLWLGPIALTLPYPLSGDSPHYLVAVNSLIEDGDFDLSNNYSNAAEGSWELGARFRGVDVDRHVDTARGGAQIGTHSPFVPLLLGLFSYPFRGTVWVGPVCVWTTALAGILALVLFRRWAVKTDCKPIAVSTIGLALATPLLCYSRDLWSEPWVTAVWLGLLLSDDYRVKSVLSVVGTLLKYPFVVVPLVMGALALWRKERTLGWALIASSSAGLLAVIGTVQYLFRDVAHFSLFHSGIHAGFGLPLQGLVGLLLSPENGLFWFSPFLAWGIWEFRKGGDCFLPAVAFFLVHASYQDWAGGTGFSARYLVPVLPLLVWAVAKRNPKGWLFWIACAYSLFWGLLAGFLPALVYDRTPWGAWGHVLAGLGGHL